MKEKCIQQKKMGNMIYTTAIERNEDKFIRIEKWRQKYTCLAYAMDSSKALLA